MVVIILTTATWVLPQAHSPSCSSLALCSSQARLPDVSSTLCIDSDSSLPSSWVQMLTLSSWPNSYFIASSNCMKILLPVNLYSVSSACRLSHVAFCALHGSHFVWKFYILYWEYKFYSLYCRLLGNQDCILWMPLSYLHISPVTSM